MPNLPHAGSPYWGAGLNNYIRSLEQEIDGLRNSMSAFTVAQSYRGIGWLDYKVTTANVTGNYNELTDTSYLDFNESQFIYKSGSALSAVQTINDKICWNSSEISGISSDELISLYGVTIAPNENNDGYSSTRTELAKLKSCFEGDQSVTGFSRDGYYPLYLHITTTTGANAEIIYAVELYNEWITTEAHILMGVIERQTTEQGTKYYFSPRFDSCYKTTYENAKDTQNSAAFIVANKPLFSYNVENDQETLKIHLTNELQYQSNGLQTFELEGTANQFAIYNTQDIKRMMGTSRRVCTIVKNDDDEFYNLEPYTGTIQTIDATAVCKQTNKIYGFYLTSFNELVIEARDMPVIETPVAVIPALNWDLNTNSQFNCGGLAFLGAVYYNSDLETSYDDTTTPSAWRYITAATNGIAPAGMTATQTTHENIVYLNDQWYGQTWSSDDDSNHATFYKYNIKPYNTNNATIAMNAEFAGKDNVYEIPVLHPDFFEAIKTSGTFNGVKLGKWNIDKTMTAGANPVPTSYRIHSDWTEDLPTLLINHPDSASLVTQGYHNIFKNVYLDGKLALNSLVIEDNYIKALKGLETDPSFNWYNGKTGTAANNSLTLNFYNGAESDEGTTPSTLTITSGAVSLSNKNLSVGGAGHFSITEDTLKFKNNIFEVTSDGFYIKKDDDNGIALKDTGLILASEANIKFRCSGAVQINNTLQFTTTIESLSDVRYKENIISLDAQACLSAVKNLDMKKFNYIGSSESTIGAIAQEIEKYCPEYASELVHVAVDEKYEDRRTVSEGKLLFILWQAVRTLLNKEE